MFEWLRFRREFAQVAKHGRRSYRFFMKESKKNLTDEEREDLEMGRLRDICRNGEDYREITSRWLVYKAARLGVVVPDFDDKDTWEEMQYSPVKVLTERGAAQLRLAIRKESNERWQYIELRLKVITALCVAGTGVVGAAIGLIAILR